MEFGGVVEQGRPPRRAGLVVLPAELLERHVVIGLHHADYLRSRREHWAARVRRAICSAGAILRV